MNVNECETTQEIIPPTKPATDYPSSNILYLTIKSEYDYELQRIQKIDTKVNIGFSLCSALFLFILKFFDFSDLLLEFKNNIMLILPLNLYFATWLVMVITYIGSFVLLLLIIRSRKYYHIDTNDLISKNLHKQPIQITEVYIATRCKQAIITNRKISNKRMIIFNVSLLLIFIVILCSVVLSFINYNFF